MVEQKVSRGRLSVGLGFGGIVKNCWKKQRKRCSCSSYKADHELLRVSNDMRLDGTLTRQAIKAVEAGDWADLVKK